MVKKLPLKKFLDLKLLVVLAIIENEHQGLLQDRVLHRSIEDDLHRHELIIEEYLQWEDQEVHANDLAHLDLTVEIEEVQFPVELLLQDGKILHLQTDADDTAVPPLNLIKLGTL